MGLGQHPSYKSIIESDRGLHLSLYLVNGSAQSLQLQIGECLDQARALLDGVLDSAEQQKFLQPISNLQADPRLLRKMNGNIGIFRKDNSFRILNLPIELKTQCHVSSSFHVKPVLQWMQVDREFYLVGLGESFADLYRGNQTSLRKIDSLFFSSGRRATKSFMSRLSRPRTLNRDQRLVDEIVLWLKEMFEQEAPGARVYFVGDRNLVSEVASKWRYRGIIQNPLFSVYDNRQVVEFTSLIRLGLKFEAHSKMKEAVQEYKNAEQQDLARKNLFQVARAVVSGKVKKLIIADGVKVFGRIDKKTGGLAIHPVEMDHEDDDILDDLAQAVLTRGGEVIVAPQDQLPTTSPVLAILNRPGV